ncbi:DUF3710 domain-containing protein [Nocardia stercoris]|uniref:DUF3710 domain-containing protein n=1 Tax=Nocardia stercoris TaxID=2483361 RepID=A0A3M2KX03_9NOCA|nr:DUF3710 domain-containing protein [Nocardia stercoris]RMI30077.1 DUF3710 domain-containing protein [Nocardia stercoris]
MFGRKKNRSDDRYYDDGDNGRAYSADDDFDDDYFPSDDYDTDSFRVADVAAYGAAQGSQADDYEDADPAAGVPGERRGPYDYDDVADLLAEVGDQRLNLGSVILPVPQGGQLQVEMTPDGTPQAVHLATELGRITVSAYAAPKTAGQWRTVATDLAESLRNDGATVSMQDGPWGRELHAVTAGADLRFIGVDGYRWMVRLVAAGPTGSVDEDKPLVAVARAILSETVVRRGDDPLPVRDPLPVVLPKELADQLVAAHQQQVQAAQQAVVAQAAAAQAVAAPTEPQGPRQGAGGSAMQQLGQI